MSGTTSFRDSAEDTRLAGSHAGLVVIAAVLVAAGLGLAARIAADDPSSPGGRPSTSADGIDEPDSATSSIAAPLEAGPPAPPTVHPLDALIDEYDRLYAEIVRRPGGALRARAGARWTSPYRRPVDTRLAAGTDVDRRRAVVG